MAKKKHKKHQHKKVKSRAWIYDPNLKDRHHFLFTAASWKGGDAGRLRAHEYCIVWIPRNTLHKRIHREALPVPVPSYQACKAVLTRLENEMENYTISLADSPSRRLKWLIEQFSELDTATAEALGQQLAIIQEFEWRELTK